MPDSDDDSTFDELFGYSPKPRAGSVRQLTDEDKPTFVISGEGRSARTQMTHTFETIEEEKSAGVETVARAPLDRNKTCVVPEQGTRLNNEGDSSEALILDRQTVTLMRSNATSSSTPNPGRFASSGSARSFATARTSSYASYRTAPSFSRRAPPSSATAPISVSLPFDFFPVDMLRPISMQEQEDSHINWPSRTEAFDALANQISFELEQMNWRDKMPALQTIDLLFWDHCQKLASSETTSIASIVSSIKELVEALCHICNLQSEPATRLNTFRGAVARSAIDYLSNVLDVAYLASNLESYFSRTSTWPLPEKRPQVFSTSWLEHLRTRGLLLDPHYQLNWSGRGQHVEYDQHSESSIPLVVEKVLGYSATAVVESVKCRRIRLARKKIRCTRHLTKADYVIEVEHLQRLQHAHILRVVGTYTFKKDLAILLYPVAMWNLDEFMDEMLDSTSDINHEVLTTGTWRNRSTVKAMQSFFGCLSHALSFIHNANIKHLDIKPKNLLIRARGAPGAYKIYIADFGIARAYKTANDAETDSPVSFTRTHAAPEVIIQDTRGFSADIFSLGCVFLEMMATLLSTPSNDERQKLVELRTLPGKDSSYQANLDSILIWFSETFTSEGESDRPSLVPKDLNHLVPCMLYRTPSLRPSATELKSHLVNLCCSACNEGPEPFEADTK